MEDSSLCVGLIDCFLTFPTSPNQTIAIQASVKIFRFAIFIYFFLSAEQQARISTAPVSSYTLTRKWPRILSCRALKKNKTFSALLLTQH
ncbi:hypothetical protein KOW79_001479 [Hemibagrus wyckioides]|uniref:Uncharacterized protein n=1 Tax=Hemibagrus wyckioides TaxID=337641 RepID=A0A9D3P579_9TELE|nr:hypothetical protein KOW79_001479 [Hemibagrus wyckioides]